MRSHTTNQMVKYQKVIEEQSRKMLEFQVDLDEEKTETLFLRQEVEKLQAERNKLKHSLEDAKQNLFRQSNLSFNERYTNTCLSNFSSLLISYNSIYLELFK